MASLPLTEPALSRDDAYAMMQNMLRIRRLEEKSAELYSQGKIRGFLHLYIGEEAIAAGAIPLLTLDDAIVATYREHGHALVRGMSAGTIMAEMYGKANGCCRGRGGSMHLFDAARRFYGGNAIVAGGLPLAVGLALADKMQQRQSVTACLFGDGAVDEGEFHESMNLATLWKLPVLFLCENNLYAMGTALNRHESQTEIFRKAEAYGMESADVDGMDVSSVRQAMRVAVNYVRAGHGPYLLEARTYRFRAHSMYDAELYRGHEEVEEWKKRDPIVLFTEQATKSSLLNKTDLDAIESAVANEVAEAVAIAESGLWEPATDLLKDVYTCHA